MKSVILRLERERRFWLDSEVWEERAEATEEEEGEEERGVEMSELAVLKEAKWDCDAIC